MKVYLKLPNENSDKELREEWLQFAAGKQITICEFNDLINSEIEDVIIETFPQNISVNVPDRGIVLINSPLKYYTEISKDLQIPQERILLYNGWLTMISRDSWEVTGTQLSEEFWEILKVKPVYCADRFGFPIQKTVSMIINEAYFTLMEGTATESDIDTAMKLGVNYPNGPFEWGAKIGLKTISDFLIALQKATGDTRYTVCPLLAERARAT
jgi:3-hydroxybutyryl-CoA dehydrogenase